MARRLCSLRHGEYTEASRILCWPEPGVACVLCSLGTLGQPFHLLFVDFDLALFFQPVAEVLDVQTFDFAALLLEQCVLGGVKILLHLLRRGLLHFQHLNHHSVVAALKWAADIARFHTESYAGSAAHGANLGHLRSAIDQLAGLDGSAD